MVSACLLTTHTAVCLSAASLPRAFGDSSHKAPNEIMISDPDVAQMKLQESVDTALVLTSDGVTDVMTQEMLGQLVKETLRDTSR
jgi:serine/threonine protein phosphatase PrpC